LRSSVTGLKAFLVVAAAVMLCAGAAAAADWPMWGGTDCRNMVSDEKGLPATFDPGKKLEAGQYDTSSAQNLKWYARMGTITCAGPVVSGGKVFVGTNRPQWVFDTGSLVSGSTLVADGKVYLGTEKGDLWVLAAGREAKLLHKVSLGAPIHTTPVAANGVLYVATNKHLFAFCRKDR
jgi:hypothetical protein